MENVCMKKAYSTPETEFLEVKISDVCQATSIIVDKWDNGDTHYGEI